MRARMTNPAFVLPDGMKGIGSIFKAVNAGGISPELQEIVGLRASQINGCSFCVDMHARDAKKAGDTDQRLFSVGAWRDAPFFDEAERAALALTEAVTRLADREDPVPDAVWQEAARHYDENGLAALLLAIASVNVWNRLNVATRQVAGEWLKSPEARAWAQKRQLNNA